MMDNPLYSDDIGRMCFNPAKNWQLDWYESVSYTSKKMIAPQDLNWVAENITLIGIADFSNNIFEHTIVVKIETGAGNDFFVGFNRASGINADNQEASDRVTVIQVDSNNGESYSQSYLKSSPDRWRSIYGDLWLYRCSNICHINKHRFQPRVGRGRIQTIASTTRARLQLYHSEG